MAGAQARDTVRLLLRHLYYELWCYPILESNDCMNSKQGNYGCFDKKMLLTD